MSDSTTTTDATASTNVIPPAAPIAQPPKADAEPRVEMTPAQLKARLEEERVKGEKKAAADVAAALGVDLDTAKKLIAEAKAKEDAQKSEVQKLTESKKELEARLARFNDYEITITKRAEAEFNALDEAQKAAVERLAGKDPAKRLDTIDALKPTWTAAQQAASEAARVKAEADAKAAADAAAKAAAEAKRTAPIPAGASTTPNAPPPPPAAPGQPTNHLAVWEDLKIHNPALAMRYRALHGPAILAAERQAKATG